MKKIFLILLLLIAFVGRHYGQIEQPVVWKFSKTQINQTEYELKIEALIKDKWHLYGQFFPDGGPIKLQFNFEESTNYTKLGKTEESPAPTEVYDEIFKIKIQYFDKKAVFTQKIKRLNNSAFEIKGTLEGQACLDDGMCVPVNADFSFKIESANGKKSETTVSTDSDSKTNLWGFFFFAFLAGLAAIFTPCVFPMIPMTVSFFMHSDKNKTKARLKALVYGLSIIVIYTVPIALIIAISTFVGEGAVAADLANWLSTHWAPNLLFFVIFMIFAASFLGMFEIMLPSSWVNKMDSNADKGGLLGSFFMAFTLVLVSFSCTGPIVGGILVQSAAGGVITEPIVGMLGFSLAFALPFTLFALFPAWLNKLPKSGGWLNSVKVVLGFLELALGLKFLSIVDLTYHWGILDREIYLAFWIVIFFLLGMYLLGKLKFSHDSEIKYLSVPRLMLAILTFTFVVYLIPGMFGAPLKALAGYIPPQTTHDFDLHTIVRNNAGGVVENLCEKPKYAEKLSLPHGLNAYFDYQQGLACAKEQNKPIFVDFTGHGCANCRKMEEYVWADPRVLKRLREDFLIITLYVDDKETLPEKEWQLSTFDKKMKKTLGEKNADFQITTFKVNSQPYYLILDHEGKQLTQKPVVFDVNVENFIAFLDEGLNNFKQKNAK